MVIDGMYFLPVQLEITTDQNCVCEVTTDKKLRVKANPDCFKKE